MKMNSLKILFAGTPDFSVPALTSLYNSSHSILAVLTQPDRPAGRGQKIKYSPIKQSALDYGLTVLQPKSLRAKNIQQVLAEFSADIMVVVAYGVILPQAILNLPKLGCINIHASLLPRWRGAAPIQRAIMAGDKQTGVTIMQMDKGLDTGDILSMRSCSIGEHTRSIDLHEQLAEMGAQLLLQTLSDLQQQKIKAIAQDNDQACYADKITKAEEIIQWHKSAIEIDRQVRAFNAWPGARTSYECKVMKIWETRLCEIEPPPGTAIGQVLNTGKHDFIVNTGKGCLQVTQLQLAGKRRMSASAFLNAHKPANKILGQNTVCL